MDDPDPDVLQVNITEVEAMQVLTGLCRDVVKRVDEYITPSPSEFFQFGACNVMNMLDWYVCILESMLLSYMKCSEADIRPWGANRDLLRRVALCCRF